MWIAEVVQQSSFVLDQYLLRNDAFTLHFHQDIPCPPLGRNDDYHRGMSF